VLSHVILWAAWAGAVAWIAFLAWGLWLGLRRGRGPGPLGWSAVLLISLAWTLGVWAFLWEPQTLAIRRVEVVSQAWRGEPLRIGVIADTHGDGPHMGAARLKRIAARMNAQRPDIILLLGDYVGGHADPEDRSAGQNAAVAAAIAALGDFDAPLGVFAVLGNHDWWYDGLDIARGLDAAGIRVLDNSSVRIDRAAGAFWVGGLSDYASEVRLPSFSDMLARVTNDEPVIAMSHWPDAFAVMPERVALLLAGHSHCGQVNLPFVGRLVHASEGSAKWPCGLYEERGRRLYVSGGVGVSMVPVRFRQPPEIAVLTLRRE
jgi:hypothetical protein